MASVSQQHEESYEFVTREKLITDEPPPYEECLAARENGVESTENGCGTTAHTVLFTAECDAAQVQPERMLWVSLVMTLVCLLWCSWPCSMSAFYLASKALKAKNKGEHRKTRMLVHYAILLNILSLAFGLITLSITIVSSVMGLPQSH